MPVAPSSPDALARTVLEKAPAPAAVLTPAQERARLLREKTTKEGPRSTLEAIRRPVGRADIVSLLDKNFGVEVDPATGQKVRAAGSAEEIRFNQNKGRAEIYSNYLEKGFDGLNAAEKTFVIGEVKKALTDWPPGQVFINTLTAPEQEELFKAVLKGEEGGDVKLPEKVRALLAERMAQAPIADEVTEKQRKFDELTQKETDKQAQITLNATELTNVSGNLAQFETTGGIPGAKLKELTRLQRRFPRLTQDLEDKSDQLEKERRQLDRLENQRDYALATTGVAPAGIDALILARETTVSTLRKDAAGIQRDMDKKQTLETEKADLTARKQTLEQEKEKLRIELQDMVRQRTMAQADMLKAKIVRGEEEEKFANSFKNLFSEASVKHLVEKIQAAEAADRKLFEEEKELAGDPGEKAVIQQMLVRWQRNDGKLIEGTIRTDFERLKNRDPLVGGADNLTKRLLDAEVAAGRLTAAEANARKTDPEFLKKLRPQVSEGLLRHYIKIGQFTVEEAEYIGSTEWGKGMILNAASKNEALMNELDELREKGLIKGSNSEFLSRLKGPLLLRLLLLFFGVAGAVGIGGSLLPKVLNP